MGKSKPLDLTSTYLRLRPDASIEALPVDAKFWERLASGALGTFQNEYLVSLHNFSNEWPTWEMHPNGDEVVCLISGAASFILELPGGNEKIELKESGAFVIVPRGIWHTATTNVAACMLFITAGEGTEHRSVAK